MKLRCALVLFLAACVCSFGQSASTILSSLRIKGATSDGGDPKYENYVPRLDTNGTLAVSVMPDLLYTNIYKHVDEFGSESQRREIELMRDGLDSKIEAAKDLIVSNMNAVVDSAVSNVWLNIEEHEKDPMFNYIFHNDGVAIGYGAESTTNAAYQIGTGTNSAQNTFKVFDTVLVGQNGEVPSNSVPWAASSARLETINSDLKNSKVSKLGDTMFGDISVNLEGVYLFTLSSTTEVVKILGCMSISSGDNRSARLSGTIAYKRAAYDGRYIQYKDTGVFELYEDNTIDGFSGIFDLPGDATGQMRLAIYNYTPTNLNELVCTVYETGEQETQVVIPVGQVNEAAGSRILEDAVRNSIYMKMTDSGLSREPVPARYIDLVSPSDNVFRIVVNDSGELHILRLK